MINFRVILILFGLLWFVCCHNQKTVSTVLPTPPEISVAPTSLDSTQKIEIDDAWSKQDEVETKSGNIKVWVEDKADEKNGKTTSSIYLRESGLKPVLMAQVNGKGIYTQEFTRVNLSPNGIWLLGFYEGNCQAAFDSKFQDFDFLMNIKNKSFFYIFELEEMLKVKVNHNAKGWLFNQPETLRTLDKYNVNEETPIDIHLPNTIKSKSQTFEQKFGRCFGYKK